MATAGRVLLLFKGDYNSATQYDPLDCVKYQGTTYVCIQTSQNNLPTNTTYFQVLAQGVANAAGLIYDNTDSGLLSTNVQNAIDELNTELSDYLKNNIVNLVSDAITLSNTQLMYNDFMFQYRGIIVIPDGTYTCNVPVGSKYCAGLAYLTMADAEKVFPSCSSLADGSTIMGFFYPNVTDGQVLTFSLIKYSSTKVQLVTTAIQSNTLNGTVTINNGFSCYASAPVMKYSNYQH